MDSIYSATTTARSAAVSQTTETSTVKGASDGSFAALAAALTGKDAGSEAGRKTELVRQLADGNSAFYAYMRAMLHDRMERSKEDREEQDIIEALGKILDALSGKEDVTGKKASLNRSAAEMAKTVGDRISKLDPSDPERIRLEQMLKRLREIGINIDLDDMDDLWPGEDGTLETLTQFLIRRQAEEISSTAQYHSDGKEVNEPA